MPTGPVEMPLPQGARRIAMPAIKELSLGAMSVRETIAQRRSRRRFSQTPMTLEELAYVCWAALGIQKVFGAQRESVFRTVPSAGARHALQLYVAAGNVAGLDCGLYRYLATEHVLAAVSDDPMILEKAAQACRLQHWIAKAAVVFFLTTVPYRMEWRYGPASPKLIALDAGHACQNIYLAAESIGAGACAIAAYEQDQTDRLLGLDGQDEFVIYIAPVGKVL
jgi:SagB-type dehydrogenase family enzyme